MQTGIENLFVIQPKQIKDERGYFERYFCKEEFKEIGLSKEIVQINHSLTKLKGSIRGMHFQAKPFSEIKIVRCIRGSIQDVAVDLRKDSKTFLHHFTVTLSKLNNKYLYIPEGFAHGFQALSNNAEVLYLTTAPFQSSADSAINPLDKILNIKWNLDITHISPKDKNAPFIDINFKGI